jgi:hypothetical protein
MPLSLELLLQGLDTDTETAGHLRDVHVVVLHQETGVLQPVVDEVFPHVVLSGASQGRLPLSMRDG